MRAAPAIVAAALVAACGGDRGAEPALIVRREIDGVRRLAQVSPGSDEVREVLADLPGEVTSALVLEGGAAMLVAIRPPAGAAEVWRVDADPFRQTRLYTGPGAAVLESATPDGTVISVGAGKLLVVDKKSVISLDPPAGSHWRIGDVSEDGTRVLISFGPDGAGCPRRARDLDCRLEVWGFDRDEPAAGWRVIARSEALVAYNGRFLPGSAGEQVLFHRAVADPTCPGPWACRVEEIVQVGWDGKGERVLHTGAWTPHLTRDGKTVAVASVPDGKVLVGPLGGELAPVTDDAQFVMGWSPDDRWVTYWSRTGGPAALVGRDGKGKQVLDDGQPIGFVRRPLPAGKVVPRKKGRDELREDTLARAREHARAGEPVELLDDPRALDEYLRQDRRVLAVVPEELLCALARETFVLVLDEAEAPFLILTNRLADGEVDVNPHRGVFPSDPPASPGTPMSVRFDEAVELVGVELPAEAKRGDTFTMTLHYKVLARPRGHWKVFVHGDGSGMRFQGDHPAPGCGTARWRPGDHVVDRVEVEAGDDAYPAGVYQVYGGFFQGQAGSWSNVRVTQGDASIVDGDQRVRLGTIQLR